MNFETIEDYDLANFSIPAPNDEAQDEEKEQAKKSKRKNSKTTATVEVDEVPKEQKAKRAKVTKKSKNLSEKKQLAENLMNPSQEQDEEEIDMSAWAPLGLPGEPSSWPLMCRANLGHLAEDEVRKANPHPGS
jgi:hypothetical protein